MDSEEVSAALVQPAANDWVAEFQQLRDQDVRAPLPAPDLERMAVAAFLLGRDDDVVLLRERAHRAYLAAGELPQAVRCAFWLGFHLQNRGEFAQAAGWLARADRLIQDDGNQFEQPANLLVLARAAMLMGQGEFGDALPLFDRSARIADRFDDVDAYVLAGIGRARCIEMSGRPADAIAMFDEIMVRVASGEVAPQVVGLAYCSMIDLCMTHLDVRRACEWTDALTGWCDVQSGLVPYRGSCLVHRAEILQLRGAWPAATAAAEDACRQLRDSGPIGAAHYRLAELHRIQGRPVAAERGYEVAASHGYEVQPGLALLRAAQGRPAAAMSGLERLLGEQPDSAARPRVQAARAEIALATGDLVTAGVATDDLVRLASAPCAPYLQALAAYSQGAMRLADGDPPGAMPPLRRAWVLWQQCRAPYESARTRVLLGAACRRLGDDDAGRMELAAARDAFEQLGATVDLASLTRLLPAQPNPLLTARELDVLRLLSTGVTNKAIADRLVLSEKTVARHVANIFGKLEVGSRSAATAYAYEHGIAMAATHLRDQMHGPTYT